VRAPVALITRRAVRTVANQPESTLSD